MIKILLISLFAISTSTLYAQDLDYYLVANIEPENKVLRGRVEVNPIKPISLDISAFHHVTLNNELIDISTKTLQLPANQKQVIRYQYAIDASNVSSMSYSNADHVLLSGAWYPQPNQLATYHLSVTLPEKFKVISEADSIMEKKISSDMLDNKVYYKFSFPHLLDQMSLVASTKYQIKKKTFNQISLETWFSDKNSQHADQYLDQAINYLKLYEKLLGPYPYKRFAMVESILPAGYSMPTYTLLGQHIIKLPFILETSLGHELLHQWFGNSVYIDRQHGNWSEGLTNYLADYYYAEQRGQGTNYRKKILSDYAAYVNPDNNFAVHRFQSKTDKANSSIGYGKVAMIFHQLRQLLGDKKFFLALQKFIQHNQFREASWHDLQREFEVVNGAPLYEDFMTWLTRTDIANIEISRAAELKMSQGKLWLNFSLKQNSTTPFHLHLPLSIYYDSKQKSENRTLHLTNLQQDFQIELSQVPSKIVIDADYHLMRELNDDEKTPSLAWLMGKPKGSVIAVIEYNELPSYQELLNSLKIDKKDIISPKKISFEQIKSHSLVILGKNNSLLQLFGSAINDNKTNSKEETNGVSIKVKRHPFNDQEVITLITATNSQEAKSSARKLRHYGKYSDLSFEQGKVTSKSLSTTSLGMTLFEQNPDQAIKIAKLKNLDQLVEEIVSNKKKVILIGEQHDRFEHHLNQLMLIKKLVNKGLDVAIGFEMFQQPYQQALDDYIAGKIDESQFLTNSHYFNKWRYDYNLYKPVIDYALKKKLPSIALNIEGDINRQISRKGLYSLSAEQLKQLPDELNFDNRKYRSDLNSVYQMHQQMRDGMHSNPHKGMSTKGQIPPNKQTESTFNFFLQSQTIWDESMAQSAHKFMQKNPNTVLVILAGNGHLKYRYGIADRLQRLSNEVPFVILQDEDLEPGIADYVINTSPINADKTPSLGVYIDTKVKDKIQLRKVVKSSVAEKAGLQAGDVLLSLGQHDISTFSDLKLALLYANTSQPVNIQIKRKDKKLNKTVNFSSKTAHHTWSKPKH